MNWHRRVGDMRFGSFLLTWFLHTRASIHIVLVGWLLLRPAASSAAEGPSRLRLLCAREGSPWLTPFAPFAPCGARCLVCLDSSLVPTTTKSNLFSSRPAAALSQNTESHNLHMRVGQLEQQFVTMFGNSIACKEHMLTKC